MHHPALRAGPPPHHARDKPAELPRGPPALVRGTPLPPPWCLSFLLFRSRGGGGVFAHGCAVPALGVALNCGLPSFKI